MHRYLQRMKFFIFMLHLIKIDHFKPKLNKRKKPWKSLLLEQFHVYSISNEFYARAYAVKTPTCGREIKSCTPTCGIEINIASASIT